MNQIIYKERNTKGIISINNAALKVIFRDKNIEESNNNNINHTSFFNMIQKGVFNEHIIIFHNIRDFFEILIIIYLFHYNFNQSTLRSLLYFFVYMYIFL